MLALFSYSQYVTLKSEPFKSMMRAWLCQLFFIILSFTPFVHFMVYTINFMITLPYHYYEYCKVTVFNGQYIGFNITSNVPLTVMVFNSSQFQLFHNNTHGTPIYYTVGGNVVGIVGPFSTGVYYVVALNNVSDTTASVTMNVTEIPVNVFYLHSSLPSPIGVADYGVIDVSSKLVGEVIKYNEAIGYATIYNISAQR